MNDFNRKMEDAGARVSKKVSEAAERLEERRRSYQLPDRKFVPAVREQSSKALRVAAQRLHQLPITWTKTKTRPTGKS